MVRRFFRDYKQLEGKEVEVDQILPAEKAYAVIDKALNQYKKEFRLYVILAAGTHVLPKCLLLTNYRAWMRATLILWWVVLLLGVATYVRWYVHL